MRLLVALDRSEESYNAFVSALDVASAFDGSVTAVHAVDAEDRPARERREGAPGADRGEEVLSDALETAANRDVPVETELLVGDPVAAIADYAEENDVTAIYVGHRGLASQGDDLSEANRGPLGSVARGIAERTQVPVTVFDRGL